MKGNERETTLAMLNAVVNSIPTANDEHHARLIEQQVHGIARLAYRLGIITWDEWEQWDETAQGTRWATFSETTL